MAARRKRRRRRRRKKRKINGLSGREERQGGISTKPVKQMVE